MAINLLHQGVRRACLLLENVIPNFTQEVPSRWLHCLKFTSSAPALSFSPPSYLSRFSIISSCTRRREAPNRIPEGMEASPHEKGQQDSTAAWNQGLVPCSFGRGRMDREQASGVWVTVGGTENWERPGCGQHRSAGFGGPRGSGRAASFFFSGAGLREKP